MNYQHLTAAARGAIEILLQEKYTVRAIARKLGRSPSTVSREITQRGLPTGYRAAYAQAHYQKQRLRCRGHQKCASLKRQKHITKNLGLGWSPEQISGRLKRKSSPLYVCHETIYAWLYSDSWARQEGLYQYLRLGRKKRQQHTGRSVHTLKIPNRVSIHDRPEVVGKRIEYGHWEGDSVIYPKKYAINTLNELMVGKVRFTKLERKTAENTAQAVITRLNGDIARTLTLDNGTEGMEHERISEATGVKVFFADTYCSNQRGANENVNMLLRGYLPKRTDISNLTQEELDDIAEELNNRPRKRLGYQTPNEVYYQLMKGESPTVALDIRM